ncbi:MAG: hypothetical protein WDM86_16915 [Rhizomicrobium sp.]
MLPRARSAERAGEERPFAAFHVSPAASDRDDRDLFDGGPPIGLQMRIGLLAPGRPNIRGRALLAVLLGWAAPFLITLIQGAVLHDRSFTSFVADYGMYARSLIAAPLLVLIEGVCFPRLSGIARHFQDGGLIRDADLPRYRQALSSTRALRDSMRLEFGLVAVAIGLVVAINWAVPQQAYQAWHRLPHSESYSLAGWWNALISVPVLIMLLLGWLWRLLLWTRFLWLMSRLDLKIIAAHPDGAGGLKFIGLSTQAFSVLAFSSGVIVAGTIMNHIVHDAAPLMAYRAIIVGFAVLMIGLLAGPLLVFSLKLLDARRRGIFEYGALARSVGGLMERKWFRRREDADAEALSVQDFSATTDLYSVTANAYAMNIVPVAWVSLILLACGALLPFLPAVLMSVSPEVLFRKLTSLFL